MFWNDCQSEILAHDLNNLSHLNLGGGDDDGVHERKSNQHFHTPATFAAFLKFLKGRVEVDDWTAFTEAILALAEKEQPRQPPRSNEPVTDYIPELKAWLHLFGVYKLERIKWKAADDAVNLVPRWDWLWQLRTWKSLPPVMCVTVVVPRKKLPKVGRLEMETLKFGRPSFVECSISKRGHSRSCYRFAAVQLGYGWPQSDKTHVRGPDAIFHVDPTHPPGLEGECHLMVSFMVPTSVLLRDDHMELMVNVHFRLTPSTAVYTGGQDGLGPGLTIYETPLHNYDQIVVTQYMPELRGIPTVQEFPRSIPPPDLQAKTTIAGTIDDGTGEITSLSTGIRFTCPELKSRFENEVYTTDIRPVSPCTYRITQKGMSAETLRNIGSMKFDGSVPPIIDISQEGSTWESTFSVSFPLLSDVSRAQLVTGPLCPENNFIQLTVPVVRPENFRRIAVARPSWIYPVVLPLPHSSLPVPILWSLPYLPCIDRLPVIDLEKIRKASEPSWHSFRRWIHQYTWTFSDWEAECAQRPVAMQKQLLSAAEYTCVLWKRTMRNMIKLCAVAGKRHLTFAICRKPQTRVEMVFYMPCLRLDIANRSLVFDGAVLMRTPETKGLMDGLMDGWKEKWKDVDAYTSLEIFEDRLAADHRDEPIFAEGHSQPDCIQLLKELLPAYVERCRTWEHDPERCEYLHRAGKTGVIAPMACNEEESSVLCSCGNGKFPDDMKHRGPPEEWEMIKNHLVRVAIPLPFGCPLVEKPYLWDDNPAPPPAPLPPQPRGPPKVACRNCEREKRRDGGELNQTCEVCRAVKYCSNKCRRDDSKRHKKEECTREKPKKK